MDDLIRRQAAIDAMEYCEPGEELFVIKSLPSAQPTEASCWGCNCPKMERLKEQKTFSEMVHLHDAEAHGVCLDTISRQMAIDAFKKELTVGESKGNYVTLCSAVSYEGAKQILESLPSAQPEQLERCPIYGGVCGYPSDQCYECPRHSGAQPDPQWIPVVKKPIKKGLMLVTYNDGDVDLLKQPTAYRRSDIVAWMPIEPWRGEES